MAGSWVVGAVILQVLFGPILVSKRFVFVSAKPVYMPPSLSVWHSSTLQGHYATSGASLPTQQDTGHPPLPHSVERGTIVAQDSPLAVSVLSCFLLLKC